MGKQGELRQYQQTQTIEKCTCTMYLKDRKHTKMSAQNSLVCLYFLFKVIQLTKYVLKQKEDGGSEDLSLNKRPSGQSTDTKTNKAGREHQSPWKMKKLWKEQVISVTLEMTFSR